MLSATNDPEVPRTMKHCLTFAACLVLALLAGTALADGALKSGPQVGDEVAAFEPLNVTGAYAGDRVCQVCVNGRFPVVLIFAREVSTSLTSLIKKVDEATVKHVNDELGSFTVVLSEDKAMPKQLREIARKEKLKDHVLTVWDKDSDGPAGYKLSKDADVTVLLYVNRKVQFNFAFKKGELQDRDISRILDGLPKLFEANK
jgi:hypothetical protein